MRWGHHPYDTQPSLEDVLREAIPWIPKVRLHNPVLAYSVGDEFLGPFYSAAAGNLSPFILVIEGSIPNENNKEESYWASLGTDKETGQPVTTNEWIDRLAPRGRCSLLGPARHMGRFLPWRQPNRLHGSPGLPGVALEVSGGHSHCLHPRMSRPAGQP